MNSFYVSYDNIKEITNDNRIIKMLYGKYKIIKTKNKDLIYKLIKERL